MVFLNNKSNEMKETDNILIDCSFVKETWPLSSSTVIYTVRIIQGFHYYSNYKPCILVWNETKDYFDELLGFEVEKIVLQRNKPFFIWRKVYRICSYIPLRLKKEMVKQRISIVLLPYHYNGLFYFPCQYQHYAIVHDLFSYDYVKTIRRHFSYSVWRLYRRMIAKKFPHLISISEETKRELLLRDGILSEVVYNSIPFDLSTKEKTVSGVADKKYILDVNRYGSSKNAKTLVSAMSILKNKIKHILYLKGDTNHAEDRNELMRLVAELGLEDKVVFDMEYRTEGEMSYLYSHADLFVSPSLKEGFGWTPIEAAILKTPVLVSDIEVFREVSCGKLTTFDPHSPEDLARHILDMLNNPPSEEERVQLSEFFLERYSLKNQIEQFTKIFERDRKSSR